MKGSAPALFRLAALATAIGSAIASRAAAAGQECIDYRDYVHIAARLDLPGSSSSVAIAGAHAYVGDETSLRVLDFADPRAPVVLGSAPLPGPARSLLVEGGRAYVACDTAGIAIVDVSNPAAPVLMGGLRTQSPAMDIALDGAMACVAVWDSGLLVADVSDPAGPVPLGGTDIPGFAMAVAAGGGYAYIADLLGLLVIDVSDPTAPEIVASVDTPSESIDLVVEDGVAYVADQKHGLAVIDISNPSAPAPAGVAELANRTTGVALAFPYAIVSATSRVYVVDVSDPASPVVAGGVAPGALAAAASGPWALALTSRRLDIIDIANPTSPSPVGRIGSFHATTDLALNGAIACLAGYDPALTLVDVSRPEAPAIAGILGDDENAYAVAARGDLACLGYDDGLRVADISSPEAPAIIGGTSETGLTGAIVIDGDLAYTSSRHRDLDAYMLNMVDLSEPASPALLGSLEIPPGPQDGLVAAGTYAYVATWSSLVAIDVSDPGALVVAGELDIEGTARGEIATDGSHVFAAAGDEFFGGPTFLVIDITSPAAPAVAGSLDLPGSPAGVALSGPHAYVGGSFGLLVIDVSDPTRPALVGGAAAPPPWEYVRTLATDGEFVYAARLEPSLEIYPLQCGGPSPVALSAFEAVPGPGEIRITWTTSFESHHAGFHLERSLRPDRGYARLTPRLITPPGPDYRFADARIEPGTTYYYRLEAFDIYGGSERFGPVSARAGAATAPQRTALGAAHPNPFPSSAPHAAIHFELARPGRAALHLYDASGRLVRLLLDRRLEAGSHTALWDGRDDAGRETGAGVYFVRLEAGDAAAETRSLVRIK